MNFKKAKKKVVSEWEKKTFTQINSSLLIVIVVWSLSVWRWIFSFFWYFQIFFMHDDEHRERNEQHFRPEKKCKKKNVDNNNNNSRTAEQLKSSAISLKIIHRKCCMCQAHNKQNTLNVCYFAVLLLVRCS